MDAVATVAKLHQTLLRVYPGTLSVKEVLETQAQTLHKEHQRGNTAVCVQISNWFPPLITQTPAVILDAPFTLADARLTVAREHGFADWESVDEAALDGVFEEAVTAVTAGDIRRLQILLQQHPQLSQQTSAYGHKATLLHYVAANGVEIWRQTVPTNAAQIAQTLLAAGADVGAKMNVYSGQINTMALLMSSSHPAEAGLTEAIAQVLRDAGSSEA